VTSKVRETRLIRGEGTRTDAIRAAIAEVRPAAAGPVAILGVGQVNVRAWWVMVEYDTDPLDGLPTFRDPRELAPASEASRAR